MLESPLKIFVGYDPRESVAYHVFCNSVLRRSSVPVSFIPLAKHLVGMGGRDGSNDFIYSRFLVPYMSGYSGTSFFFDGDMVCLADVAELLKLRTYDPVSCVKHDYRTKHGRKYLGALNEDYARKNWSSVMMFNCGHYDLRRLTPETIGVETGAYLHRMEWASSVGALPIEWNWLPQEHGENLEAKLVHYTIGTPCFKGYEKDCMAGAWHAEREEMTRCDG